MPNKPINRTENTTAFGQKAKSRRKEGHSPHLGERLRDHGQMMGVGFHVCNLHRLKEAPPIALNEPRTYSFRRNLDETTDSINIYFDHYNFSFRVWYPGSAWSYRDSRALVGRAKGDTSSLH